MTNPIFKNLKKKFSHIYIQYENLLSITESKISLGPIAL